MARMHLSALCVPAETVWLVALCGVACDVPLNGFWSCESIPKSTEHFSLACTEVGGEDN